MSTLDLPGSNLGSELMNILVSDDIVPGSEPSYQLCKEIYSYHPLGAKIAELPVQMMQSQEREISVPDAPEELVRDAFIKEWKSLGVDTHIFNTMRQARIYGIASVAMLVDGQEPEQPIDLKTLPDAKIAFNVFDPLNTAGSLVLNQNPNAFDFQKPQAIRVMGKAYHPSRSVIMMQESPIYLGYVVSSYGYTGRSVYQRALFPLKSYIRVMIANEFIALKAGVLVAKQKTAGSIIDQAMAVFAGLKRAVVKEAQTYNVISIGTDEDIESLNLQNLDGALKMARTNIVEDIAAAAPMPAKLLTEESYALGFGEGSEDAKYIAQFIDRLRIQASPLYDFFTLIAQYRAWSPAFYKTIQRQFPEKYAEKSYDQALYEWRNSFTAAWPSLLREPDSELIKVDDVKLKAIIAALEVMLPAVDPENKALLLEWAAGCLNENKLLFAEPLNLDFDALREYEPPVAAMPAEQEPHESRPFAANDSARTRRAMRQLSDAVAKLPNRAARARLKEIVGQA